MLLLEFRTLEESALQVPISYTTAVEKTVAPTGTDQLFHRREALEHDGAPFIMLLDFGLKPDVRQ